MKRVLNSGSITVVSFHGTEKEVLSGLSPEVVCGTFHEYLFKMDFKLKVKAPLVVLLAFQDARLGTIKRYEDPDSQIAYLPSEFYSQDALTYNIMDAKACNVHYTKLNNYFEWSFNFYNKLVKDGLCKEQAQLVLPLGLFVNFSWKVDAFHLIQFIEENWNKSPEMYGYCSTLVIYLEEHLPEITKWLKKNKWQNIGL